MDLSWSQLVGNHTTLLLMRRGLQSGNFPKFSLNEGFMGTGKSTSAKLAALALTCENYPTDIACGTCATCKENLKALASGSSSRSLVKRNMATIKNTKSLEDLVREIFDLLQGTVGNTVYILEEIQETPNNLQGGLLEEFNRLSENTYVIATTTRASALTKELVSRAMPFRFDRLTDEEMKLLFDQTMARLKIPSTTRETEQVLIRNARGVPRDLVKMIEFVRDTKPTNEQLKEFVGVISNTAFIELFSEMKLSTRDFMRTVKYLLSKNTLQGLLTQLKGFLYQCVYVKEVGESDSLTKEEIEAVSQLYTTEEWYKIGRMVETLKVRDIVEEDFQLFMLRLRQTVVEGSESVSFSNNNKKASVDYTQAEEAARNRSRLEERTNPVGDKKVSTNFLNSEAFKRG